MSHSSTVSALTCHRQLLQPHYKQADLSERSRSFLPSFFFFIHSAVSAATQESGAWPPRPNEQINVWEIAVMNSNSSRPWMCDKWLFHQLCIYVFIIRHHIVSFFFTFQSTTGRDLWPLPLGHLKPSPSRTNRLDVSWKLVNNEALFLEFRWQQKLLEIKRKFFFKKKKRSTKPAVFTLLIISLCLLSYPNTNYCFLSARQKGWGCIFKQPGVINNSPSTDNMCVCVCQDWRNPLKRVAFIFTDSHCHHIIKRVGGGTPNSRQRRQ